MSSHSMRNKMQEENKMGGEGKKRKENYDENSGHYIIAGCAPNGDRLQCHRSCQ